MAQLSRLRSRLSNGYSLEKFRLATSHNRFATEGRWFPVHCVRGATVYVWRRLRPRRIGTWRRCRARCHRFMWCCGRFAFFENTEYLAKADASEERTSGSGSKFAAMDRHTDRSEERRVGKE